ncbi:MAG: flagellar basal body P-ring formation chaperone FlgA, partial [Candidatus Gastranaerophilales bacterium]|nr:flagellar basal body P-ring formation chaperone FlgA [Candidatus Gastranaerophilales bacterium]
NLRYFSPNTILRVTVFSNNKYVKSFGVPVSIRISDNVLVAKDFIENGQALSTSNLAVEKKDISLKVDKVLRADFNWSDMITRKQFKAGDIIDKRFIESAPEVVKNSPVSIIFQTANLKISLDAQAMEDGKIGDFIKVKCKKYQKSYRAKVISENTVLVNI